MTPDVLPEVLVVGGQEELVMPSQVTEHGQGVFEDVAPIVEVQEVTRQDREASVGVGPSVRLEQPVGVTPCAVAPIVNIVPMTQERRPRRQAAIKAVERVKGWLTC